MQKEQDERNPKFAYNNLMLSNKYHLVFNTLDPEEVKKEEAAAATPTGMTLPSEEIQKFDKFKRSFAKVPPN